MVLTTRNYPQTMKALPPRVRRKAVELGNQFLAEGYQMQRAMIIAMSMAREWAEHRQAVRERNLHVVPHHRGWMVRRVCGPEMTFADKTCALSYAVEMARAEGVYVIAHDESGAIDAHIHITCRS
jgi:uncharacterized protein YdaT